MWRDRICRKDCQSRADNKIMSLLSLTKETNDNNNTAPLCLIYNGLPWHWYGILECLYCWLYSSVTSSSFVYMSDPGKKNDFFRRLCDYHHNHLLVFVPPAANASASNLAISLSSSNLVEGSTDVLDDPDE